MALLIPDADVAYQILALNTEKAHNLREKSLETIRMLRALADEAEGTEEAYALSIVALALFFRSLVVAVLRQRIEHEALQAEIRLRPSLVD